MKKIILSVALIAASFTTFAQVGIGTTTPIGVFHTVQEGGAWSRVFQRATVTKDWRLSVTALGNLSWWTRDNATNVTTARIYFTQSGAIGIDKSEPKTKLAVKGLPIHADNIAAKAATLTAGDFYRTATGQVMVVF